MWELKFWVMIQGYSDVSLLFHLVAHRVLHSSNFHTSIYRNRCFVVEQAKVPSRTDKLARLAQGFGSVDAEGLCVNRFWLEADSYM